MKLEQTIKKILILVLMWSGITAMAYLIIQQMKFFNSINELLFDQFTLYSTRRQPDNRIILIDRNDQSLEELGNPVPRLYYDRLVRKLSLFNARTIVFDLFFINESDQNIDRQFAQTSDSLDHVVHCFAFSDNSHDEKISQDSCYEKYAISVKNAAGIKPIRPHQLILPHEKFIDSFHQAGFATVKEAQDGRIRRVPLLMDFNNKYYPELILTTLFDYFGVTSRAITIEKTFWGQQVAIETPQNGTIKIPINSDGEVLLNFYGLFNVFEPIPLHEMVRLIDAIQLKNPQVNLPMFYGRIVLIGTSETSVDRHSTTFSANFPGMGIHATLLSNILQNYVVFEVNNSVNFLILAFLNLILVAVFVYYYKTSRSIWAFVIFAVILIIIFNMIVYFLLYNHSRIWLQLVQLNSVYMVLFISLLFYDKVIRLRNLNFTISQIENYLLVKKTDLERLDQRINSQTEQYKIIEYFTRELQTILDNPAEERQVSSGNFFPKFLESQAIIKAKLEDEINQLKSKKEDIVKETERLEQEKNIYQKIIRGQVAPKPARLEEKSKVDKAKIARQIMTDWQYFQTQQKKGNGTSWTVSGIVALPTIVNEKGEKIRTRMGEILETIKKISSFDSTVFITGESGTGKEIVSRAIHEQSKRMNKPFVEVNCAAIPENLMESELFGHKKGAFTGALYDHKGKFEYANGGTIFLDEIGDLKLDLQAKLLRVLESSEIQKVGSNTTVKVDVRIISATNKNLKKCIQNNEFRNDLYARLNVIDLKLPPLRTRKHDIPFLLQYFLDDFNAKYNMTKSFSGEAVIAAMCYDWPDNIRELKNFIEKVYTLTTEDEIPLSALPAEIQAAYRNIFESPEVPWWSQIEKAITNEQDRLLEACKTAIKENKIDEFWCSAHLQADHKSRENCYDYLCTFVNGTASIFSADKREALVRQTIVNMQEELFHWCRDNKISKLDDLYCDIKKLLGRSRRQVDNWRKENGGR